MSICGFCKTLYPEIDVNSDEVCLACRSAGDDRLDVEEEGDY